MVALTAEPVAESDQNTRPEPDRWSVAEYGDHIRETLFGMRMLVELAMNEPGMDLGPEITPAPAGKNRALDFESVRPMGSSRGYWWQSPQHSLGRHSRAA